MELKEKKTGQTVVVFQLLIVLNGIESQTDGGRGGRLGLLIVLNGIESTLRCLFLFPFLPFNRTKWN